MTAALERGEWSATSPGRTLPPGKIRYAFYRRLGGPQGRSGRAENLVPTGIRSRTVHPVAQSLYRMSYPAHTQRTHIIYIIYNERTSLFESRQHARKYTSVSHHADAGSTYFRNVGTYLLPYILSKNTVIWLQWMLFTNWSVHSYTGLYVRVSFDICTCIRIPLMN